MTKLLIASGAVLVAVLATVMLRSGSGERDAERAADSAERHVELAAVESVVVPTDVGRDREASAAQPAITAPSERAAPAAQLTCRIIDTSGQPIADARVQVSGWKWIERARHDLSTVTTLSDAEGRVALTLPVDDDAIHTLKVIPGEFHVTHEVQFQSAGTGEPAKLVAGPNDMGDITLARAGAARGRVVDQSGEGLAGVEVEMAPGDSGWYGLLPRALTLTDGDGRYTLGHVSVGTLGVRYVAAGHVSAFNESVSFEAGQITPLADVVLERSGILAGRVVDEDGAAVVGQSVVLRSIEDWMVSEATATETDENGAFRAELRARGPHKVSVRRKGFVNVGGLRESGPIFEPGTEDIEIVLKAVPRLTLLVRDAFTGEPVERFGVRVISDRLTTETRFGRLSQARERPRLREGGVVEVPARPGVDSITIDAPGYEPFEADAALNGSAPRTQLIELHPAPLGFGLVFRHGEPVVGATVRVTEHRSRNRTLVEETQTDAEGAYKTSGLGHGEYELRATTADGSATATASVSIARDATAPLAVPSPVQLPTIEFVGTGAIRGRVLLPPGGDTVGYTVYLGRWQDAEQIPVGDDGTFFIDDVPAGQQKISLTAPPGRLSEMPAIKLDVREGEVVDVTIDASRHGVCTVDIKVEIVAPWVDVEWFGVMTARAVSMPRLAELPYLQATTGVVPDLDETGRASFETRASGVGYIQLLASPYPSIVLVDAPLVFEHGATVSHEVRFIPARLEISVPDSVVIEPGSQLQVGLRDARFAGDVQTFAITRERNGGVQALIVDGKATLDFVACGDLVLAAVIPGARSTYRAETEVSLRAGELTRVSLPVDGR